MTETFAYKDIQDIRRLATVQEFLNATKEQHDRR